MIPAWDTNCLDKLQIPTTIRTHQRKLIPQAKIDTACHAGGFSSFRVIRSSKREPLPRDTIRHRGRRMLTGITDPAAEWLGTDSLGGFASGTVGGERTRRYHALLLTATTPPTRRIVLVNGIEAW